MAAYLRRPVLSSATRLKASATLILCMALLAGVVHPSDAQIVLEGRVVDDMSGLSLVGARVLLLNRYRKIVGHSITNQDGRFRFERRQSDMFRLETRAVGYREAVSPLVWITENRDSTEMEVRLARFAVLLAPLEIVGMSSPKPSAVLENVEHRISNGFGYHLTREDIEERRPQRISDLLMTLPGVNAAGRSAGGGRNIYMSRALPGLPGGCPVKIFVDGMLANRDDDGSGVIIDDLVSPLDIEVIEVFRGLGTIPPEFLTFGARCGVIAIWTRRSLERGREQ
ncbi:carboxypeptidase regulatory-like domain-containing protein [Gemmatimonadota bacterium]